MKINFTKMHGLGNDFIVVDGRFLHKINYKKFAANYCERNFGIGADGLIVLEISKTADFKMLIYNADGEKAQICGNGLRCLAKYIYDKGLRKNLNSSRPLPNPPPQVVRGNNRNIINIETDAGIKTAKLFIKNKKISSVEISLGEPIFDPRLIPILNPVAAGFSPRSINYPIKIKNQTFKINCVSMGNPHCVMFTKKGTDTFFADKKGVCPLFRCAETISNHPIFPQKTNVEFVEIVKKNHINVFVYERGVGPTLACGTGAAAAAVISILLKNLNRKLKVTLPGGNLFVRWDKKDNEVYLKGPAETVFEGIIRR